MISPDAAQNVPGVLRRVLFCLALALSGCSTFGPARPGETIHRNVVYAERDGKKLHLDLYVPAQPRPAPVVLWIHGGGWKYGDKGYSLLFRDLTRDGFAIASVQYRLVRTARWPAQIDDCRDALAWLQRHGPRYGLDPHRLALAGESAGGHLAALLGLQRGRGEVRAVCALYPPTDLVAMGERYADYRKLSIFTQLFGGEIRDRAAAARLASPVTYADPRAPAFLLYHGDRDWLVPPDQSQRLHARLRAAGVVSELHLLPGQGHAFALDDAQLQHVAAFLRRHLR